jgi:sulfur-oxidizing protein SoxY
MVGWWPNPLSFYRRKNMQTRRDALKRSFAVASLLMGAGLLPQVAQAFEKSAFDAKSVADVFKALGLPMPAESKDVALTAPDIAENGAVVPMTVQTNLPGVKKLMLLVEKNPSPLVALFMVNPSVETSFQTRAKMGQSCDVYAVAVMEDGKTLFSKKEVKVTLGGCGG